MKVFFAEVLGFCEVLFEFFVSFIESLLMAIRFLSGSGPFNLALIGLLPPIIGTCMTIVLAIGVAKFLLGR